MEEKKNWYTPISDEEFGKGKVSNLSNRPNQTGAYGVGGLSAQALKEWFDKSSTLLKDKLNELLVAITSGDMADELKVDLTDEITSLQALCDSIKSGEISDILPVKGEDVGTSMTLNAALARVYERASDLEAGAVKGATVSGEGDLIRIDLLNKDNASVAGADVSCGLELNAEKNELSVVFKDKGGAVLARSAPVTINEIKLADNLEGNDTDKAPSVQAVNEGLAEKQDKIPLNESYKGIRVLFGRQANKTEPVEIAAAAGNAPYNVAFYIPETTEGKDAKGTLPVTYPRFPIHAANKQFVEDSLVPLKREVANIQAAALGKLYTTQEYWVQSLSFGILEGALPHFYCGDISIEFYSGDGSFGGTANAETITFYDSNGAISTVPISQRYIEIPEGATSIGVDWGDIANANNYPTDHVRAFGQMIFQIKTSGGAVDSNIEAALDNIIEIQNSLIGGDSE